MNATAAARGAQAEAASGGGTIFSVVVKQVTGTAVRCGMRWRSNRCVIAQGDERQTQGKLDAQASAWERRLLCLFGWFSHGFVPRWWVVAW